MEIRELALNTLWLALFLFGIALILAIVITSIQMIQKNLIERKLRKIIEKGLLKK